MRRYRIVQVFGLTLERRPHLFLLVDSGGTVIADADCKLLSERKTGDVDDLVRYFGLNHFIDHCALDCDYLVERLLCV